MERAIPNMHQCAWIVDRQRAEHCAQRNVHSLRSTHRKPERDWELAAAAAARVRNATASGEARRLAEGTGVRRATCKPTPKHRTEQRRTALGAERRAVLHDVGARRTAEHS
jgi:hypothetical protein